MKYLIAFVLLLPITQTQAVQYMDYFAVNEQTAQMHPHMGTNIQSGSNNVTLKNAAPTKEKTTQKTGFISKALNYVKKFTILTANGVTKKIFNNITPKTAAAASVNSTAEITVFRWLNIIPTAVTSRISKQGLIHSSAGTVYIPIFDNYNFFKPIKITMENLKVSQTAKITSDDYTGVFNFSSFDDTKVLRIKAENGTEKAWQIKLVFSPQLENSSFESWNTSPFSLKGRHWAVNNNKPPLVSPVVMVEPSDDAFSGLKSAEISTRCVTRGVLWASSTIPVSAGTLFAGEFKFSASKTNIKNPSGMYKYGVPFTYAPTFMHVALKYLPASPTYKGNVPTFSFGMGHAIPKFQPEAISEPDSCHIWVNVYDATACVIGKGEFSSGSKISTWTEIYIPIKYHSTNSPNKISAYFTSSKKGLDYIGASGGTSGNTKGSILLVDDVEFQYLPKDFPHPSLPQ